jgi:thiamine-phosphate pyrophosphorylase
MTTSDDPEDAAPPAPPTPPAVVVVTDRGIAEAAGHTLRGVVAAALAVGAGGVLLREKDLPAAARGHMAEHVRALTASHGAELWIASDVAVAEAVGADGVHLAASDPWPDAAPARAVPDSERRGGCPPTTTSRRTGDSGRRGRQLRFGRSCHTVAELEVARRQGADRVTYSPVFATDSKPGYGPALGLDGLKAGCRAVPGLAVIALGGVGPGRVRACVEAGASGVAIMGAAMGADDPAAVVRAVVAELTEARA